MDQLKDAQNDGGGRNPKRKRQEQARLAVLRAEIPRMELLTYIYGGVGAVVLLFVAQMVPFHSPYTKVWVSVTGIILLAFGLGCFWHGLVAKQEAQRLSELHAAENVEEEKRKQDELERSRSIAQQNIAAAHDDKLNKILEVQERMARVAEQRRPDFRARFPLGYVIFSMMGKEEVLPAKVNSGARLQIDWKDCAFKLVRDEIHLQLPDFTFNERFFNLLDSTAVLKNTVGSTAVLDIDASQNPNGWFGNTFKGRHTIGRNPEITLTAEIIQITPSERIAVLGIQPFKR